MLDSTVSDLGSYQTQGKHSISGLSSGAFMTVQLHIAHSSSFVGAGVIAGGPYRAAETFRGAAMTVPTSCILNSLYIAMTPLTPATAPDTEKLLGMAQETEDIDDLAHVAGQRMYIFTGTRDTVVNQFAVRSTHAFYEALGVRGDAMMFVDDIEAGHSIITMNPEDNPLDANRPPYINKGEFIQSHELLRHIYGPLAAPADARKGDLIRFEQKDFVPKSLREASMAEFGYAYIPSRVASGEAQALGVHIALHGCKQGYAYVDFINGRADIRNQPPYGTRYVTSTGYLEIAEANDLIVLFPQVDGGDDNAVQNPEGCWDWWGYCSDDPNNPDYYSRSAVQIQALYAMLTRLTGG
ncbi:hypothetical protein [Tropicibacter naphthalenivorans]|uniref:Esterase, PHB depolymerase family n=1 Tax=Tropicibacter naphthalenivorans TaxID=441103 RepID=A0A0P1G9Q9_9RHOB|nr:hypothetical protein [Tropicibacter naphthalenivorans]CUH78283.1 esterase, PHB depolymerase family [Tropicibacter naphthalenivorans]SMC78976.1 hypothetical protein SAMN04488093_10457 [Tropicibacter naphthalenivorans]